MYGSFVNLIVKFLMKYFSADLKFNLKNKLPNSLISMTLKVIEIGDKFDENLPKDSPNKGHNSKLIYDTLCLKPKVKENNPKTLVSEIKKQKLLIIRISIPMLPHIRICQSLLSVIQILIRLC